MERKIMKDLLAWKGNPDRKPLLITGVRQCGKTYVIQEFGKQYFEDVAYVNFEGNDGLCSIFDYDYDIDRIIDEIGNTFLNKEIIPGKTLLILDEIQACPRAITSLKYFCENMRALHVICAGSLLGVAIKSENISFPVGKVDRMQMYPMNFEEFVRADGGEKYLHGAMKYSLESELPEAYTIPLERYYKNFLIVGGMPEVVAKWIATHDYSKIETIQDTILEGYSSDFSKHAPLADVPKLGWIWESVPKQLAKDNNKFVFSHVKEGKRSKELEDALQWLKDAGLIYQLELVSNPELPLAFEADATYFKIYLSDVGLLRRKSNVSYKTILNGDDNYVKFKGALTENYVMNELMIQGRKPYFWKSGNTAELDFLIEDDGRIVPIEVKAADNTRAKSYIQFCKKYTPVIGIKMSLKNCAVNICQETETYSLPLYLIWRLGDCLGK